MQPLSDSEMSAAAMNLDIVILLLACAGRAWGGLGEGLGAFAPCLPLGLLVPIPHGTNDKEVAVAKTRFLASGDYRPDGTVWQCGDQPARGRVNRSNCVLDCIFHAARRQNYPISSLVAGDERHGACVAQARINIARAQGMRWRTREQANHGRCTK